MILDVKHFREVVTEEFAFLADELGFQLPIYAMSGDLLVATFEDGKLAIVLECGKREAYVWTLLKNLALDRQLGLDGFHDSHFSEPEYPPSMGGSWESFEEVSKRLKLEAQILRTNFPAVREDPSTFEEWGSPVTAETVQLDDPAHTFPRRCKERFRFLVDEFGLREEIQSQSEVLYIGADRGVRITLLYTSYEDEEEAHPTLAADVVPIVGPGGELAAYHDDAIEIEISDREGPFSAAYLEDAFDELESALRSLEPLLRRRAHA